ncbi:MAG TPA: serine/threonine-protein kinase [Thermoanaerobaculia bacterium]
MSMTCFGCKASIGDSFRACPHCGAVVTDFERRFANEPLDGKYEIVERVGVGGMGEVYRALHKYLGATRIIKVIRPEISGSDDIHARFLREARAATKIQHPNVAALHDFSQLPDGSHYMVWEYIDGENLAQRLRARGRLSTGEALHVAVQALQGLEAIHRAGIVHRDISPENLMVSHDDGTVKIIDLGVAKFDDPTETSSTRTGMFVGKFRYASPEQLGFLPEGERIDGRTDIYAVGMVLFESLTGRPPYEAKSPHEYFLLHARPLPSAGVEVPPHVAGSPLLQPILDRALARDRNQRFQSAAEMAIALEAVQQFVARQTPAPTAERSFTAAGVLPQQETLRTPIPSPPTEPATLAPAGHTTRVESSPRRSIVFLGALLLAVSVLAVYQFWPRYASSTETPRPMVVAQVQTPEKAPAPVQESAVEVVVATETAAPAATPAPLPVTTAPKPTPAPARERRVEPVKSPQKAPAKAPVVAAPVPVEPERKVAVYVDGGDDSTLNERLLEVLREETQGVKTIELHGGSMDAELRRSLREYIPHLEISTSAAVVVRFDGAMERLGYGRKRRVGHGSVLKNGRVIFRYELPDEVFRVGMHPNDAFARVLSFAFKQ